ncbi:MAG: hypothetical protein K0Q59_431 [Paenibacillus sp.]|jgi:AraC-like DNA-binding protein|nr:hypothetical protein [Paenibacillus sp.]
MSFASTDVLFISRCKYKFESFVVDHSHNFHHLLYVTGGSGTMVAEGVSYTMRENDMYIVAPGTSHSFVSDPASPLCTLEVKTLVNNLQLETYMAQLPFKMIVPHVKLKLIMEAMLEEAVHGRPQYKEIITVQFMELVMNLLRFWRMEEQRGGTCADRLESGEGKPHLQIGKAGEGEDVASLVLNYFHEHYERKIVLKDVARRFMVSDAHLCRAFVERYEIPPMQYLNNWRLKKAKELLANTELSITEISAKVGFQSVHYLSRRFTAKEQMTPLQYRHMMQEIVELKIAEKYDIVDQKIVI